MPCPHYPCYRNDFLALAPHGERLLFSLVIITLIVMFTCCSIYCCIILFQYSYLLVSLIEAPTSHMTLKPVLSEQTFTVDPSTDPKHS